MLTITKKAIYLQCILSKLLLGWKIMENPWLSQTGRKILNAFHVRCLRQIYRISHSIRNKVSNQYILQKYGTIPLSNVLPRRQLLLFSKIARLDAKSPVRKLIFRIDCFDLVASGQRKRRRPRQE